MERIASFQVDHNKLVPGMYLSRRDGDVATFDLRFKKPNTGDLLSNAELHSVEHIIATLLRNGRAKDAVIYFGPMGCRTGFYLLTRNLSFERVKQLLTEGVAMALALDEIPGSKREECGNYLEHDLESAIEECKKYTEILNNL